MTTCWGGLGCQRHKSGSVGGFRRRVCAFFFFFFSLLVMYHNNLTPDMDSDSPTCRTESPVGTLCQKTPEEASSPASSSESSAKVWMALLIIYSTCSRKLTPPPFMQVSLCLLSWRWGEGEGELIDTILINLRLILFFFFYLKAIFGIFDIFWVGVRGDQRSVQVVTCQNISIGRVVMIPTSWDQMWACRCSGSLRKINPFRRLHSIPASVLTSETMIKSNIDPKEAISGGVYFKNIQHRLATLCLRLHIDDL